jgi:flagellin
MAQPSAKPAARIVRKTFPAAEIGRFLKSWRKSATLQGPTEMSSILTNNSAMVALQTLKNINSSLAKTQDMISTGKAVGSAKDNAAVWAISKVMESDVKGFKAISDSLSLGESTVAVAQNGAETVTDLLTQIKGKIVASQEANVDRTKIQTDIAALRDQITSVVGAAQFNGLNLLSNVSKTAGSGTVNILSSLDRASDGSVTTSNISVGKWDLGTTAQAVAADAVYAAGSGTAGAASATLTATQSQDLVIAGVAAGKAFSLGMTGTDADSSKFVPGNYTTAATVAGASNMVYIAKDGDTATDVATALKAKWDAYAAANGLDTNVLNFTVGDGKLVATSGVTDATDTIAVRVDTLTSASDGHTIGGGLADLGTIDVSTDAGAASALAGIESLIQTAINASAAFGSSRGRIETQMDFVGKLTDSLKTGIGSMIDANMEEASARLQALQVQQQLGVQSLSIANQAPQSILSLFR